MDKFKFLELLASVFGLSSMIMIAHVFFILNSGENVIYYITEPNQLIRQIEMLISIFGVLLISFVSIRQIFTK